MDGTKELPARLEVRLFKSIAATDFVGRLMSQLQHFPILGSGSVSDLPVTGPRWEDCGLFLNAALECSP